MERCERLPADELLVVTAAQPLGLTALLAKRSVTSLERAHADKRNCSWGDDMDDSTTGAPCRSWARNPSRKHSQLVEGRVRICV